jgi:hypothetical protein
MAPVRRTLPCHTRAIAVESRRTVAAWAAASAVGLLLAFAPAVAGLRTLAHRDTDLLYAPVRTLVVEELRSGHLPLWNPYEGTGKPLFAEGIHSVLHPVSLVAAVVAPRSIDFLLLAYLLAATLGAYLLARTLGASPPASASAGLAYSLGGFSASMTGNVVFLAGLSSLPFLLAAARRAGEGWRWGTVATACATACAFLSGDAQVALVGILLGLLLAADAAPDRPLLGARRALPALALGTLVASVQIAATRALIATSSRSLELTDLEKARWSLDPGRLVEWIVPGIVFGPARRGPTNGLIRLDEVGFAESVYLGVPLLIAAGLGAVALRAAARRRTALLLTAASSALLWLALGHHLGARQALDWLPVWKSFRYSEKLMAPLSLALCALAALGLDALFSGPLSTRGRRRLAAAAVAAAVLLALLRLVPGPFDALAGRLIGEAGPFYRFTLADGLPHLVAALGALLAADRLSPGRARTWALALLVPLAPAAALSYGAHFGNPEAHRFRSPLRLESDAPTPRILQLEGRLHSPEDPEGTVDATARIEGRFLGQAIAVAHRIDSLEGYGAFDARRQEALQRVFGTSWLRAARRYGLTHVPVQINPHLTEGERGAQPALAGGRVAQRDESIGLEVWAVPHRPWAFFAARTVAAGRLLDARRLVTELIQREEDATVVVEASAPPPTAPGRILRVERGTETVRIEAEADGPALLVVQDAFWPGWRASIDGRPAPILAADFLVRGVPFPAGRHRLEMTYDPPEVRVGLALSGLGLILLLAAAARAWRGAPASTSRTPPSSPSGPGAGS